MRGLPRRAHGPPDPLAASPGVGLEGDRWWGWGGEGPGRPSLKTPALKLVARRVGADVRLRPPVPLDRVEMPEPVLEPRARDRLAGIVGDDHLLGDRLTRVRHAAGRSYEDLIRLRAGDATDAPDAMVAPGSGEEVAAVLEVCVEERVGVVPFGGGTSVVGGVGAAREETARAGLAGVVSLSLQRLDRLLALDARSLTATFEAGIGGREAEALLAGQGLTLGHFPQSFERATMGGYLATRSVGQASTGYGRFDELVVGLRCATPLGELRVEPVPATAAGPALLELIIGSEGTLGVVTEVTLAVRTRPAARHYEAWSLPTFDAGTEALRELAQADRAPDVARLSDAAETALALAQAAADGGVGARALRGYLRGRGQARPCLVVVGYEGEAGELTARRRGVARVLRAHGAVALGARPGRAWARSRFEGPYLRDDLLDAGILVETLETATTWSNLERLYARVREALERSLAARGTPPIVGCHVSHVYAAGASLYFTVLAAQEEGAELEQWQVAKRAASEAILAAGGTITHHHAVGRAHREWLEREVGEMGIAALRAVKERLDPTGIMNPGRLVPPPTGDG